MAGAAGCLSGAARLASLVARATARARELAVRTAMGAGQPARAPVADESLVLALAGGGLELLIAFAGPTRPTRSDRAAHPEILARHQNAPQPGTTVPRDRLRRAAGFRAARRAGVAVSRKAQNGEPPQLKRRGGLVIAQVSVSSSSGSAGLIRTLFASRRTTGFSADHVLTMRTLLPWENADRRPRVAFYQRSKVKFCRVSVTLHTRAFSR
jgi:hypothetical protein